MPDLRVWLESQATFLRKQGDGSAPVRFGESVVETDPMGYFDGIRAEHRALATLIDDLLEVHFECDCLDAKAIGPHCDCGDSSACTTLRALATCVSAVTGNTPPEGAQ